MEIPLHRWGTVARPPPDEPGVDRVRVEASGDAFLVLVRDSGTVFDTWLKTADEVEDHLRSMDVSWEKPQEPEGPSTGNEMPSCDECGSQFRASSSPCAALCVECARILYGHPRCPHAFEEGRCVRCGWDGSSSAFTRSQSLTDAS